MSRHLRAAAVLGTVGEAAVEMVRFVTSGRTHEVGNCTDAELDTLAQMVAGLWDGTCHTDGPRFFVGPRRVA